VQPAGHGIGFGKEAGEGPGFALVLDVGLVAMGAARREQRRQGREGVAVAALDVIAGRAFDHFEGRAGRGQLRPGLQRQGDGLGGGVGHGFVSSPAGAPAGSVVLVGWLMRARTLSASGRQGEAVNAVFVQAAGELPA
jgi:hypothetical protein